MDATTALQALTKKIDGLTDEVRQINTYIQNDPLTGREGIPTRLSKIEAKQSKHEKEIKEVQEARKYMLDTKKLNIQKTAAIATGGGILIKAGYELGELLLKLF